MKKELQEISQYLKENYRFGNETSGVSEPDQWEDKPYAFCDEKVINYEDGFYHISDIDNIHQTLKFKTKEEVLNFFEGHSEGYQLYFENPEDTARALGKLTTIIYLMGQKETQDAFTKAISPLQKKYELNNADAG
jgi:hypothetical protein